MGAELGAVVDLENAPLKYQGLSYTEIWISEAQERMVLAVPPEKWPALADLCQSEGRRGDRPGRVHRLRPAHAALPRAGRRRPVDAVPARRPPGGRSRGKLDAPAGSSLEPARRP